MPKKILKVSISNQESTKEIETKAIIQDEIIKYKEDENTIVLFDLKNKKLIRENEKIKMEYVFSIDKTTQGIIEIKDLSKKVKIDIITNEFQKRNHYIKLKYQIEEEQFIYEIEEKK